MQEIKTLILRVGTVANVEEYVFDGPMADAHIQGFLNQGFTLHTSHPGSVDQSTSSMSVFYTLIRETQPDMDVSKAQEQVNQMVSDKFEVARQPLDDNKWVQPEVSIRTDHGRFA